MGWCMREPYCPLSSAVCNATIPTKLLFEMARICMFAVLLRFTLSFVNKVYVGFLSRVRERRTVNMLVKVQYIWKYGCIQQFASKHKPQTFSRVCLRLKRGVYRWKLKCFTAHVTLSSAEAYMKFLVRERERRKERWEELNKGSLCELMQSIWRRI
jgi:hypothetical protein